MSPAAKPSNVSELRHDAEAIAGTAPDVRGPVEHDTLAAALVAALSDLTVIEPKNNADMGSFKVRYADLASLVKLTRRQLADHGLVVLTPLCHLNDSPAVQVTIVHEGGESMTFGPFPFQHGRDAQATGSWVTYMRRYALVAALGMAAGDDDDGAAAQPRPSAAEQAAQEQAEREAAKEAAKDIVRELAKGDKDVAKAAWAAIGGGKWDRESLTAAFAHFMEPKDASAVEGETTE